MAKNNGKPAKMEVIKGGNTEPLAAHERAPDAPLISKKALAAADAEQAKAAEREKEEKLASLVNVIEGTQEEIERQAYKLKTIKETKTGLLKQASELGVTKDDLEAVLAERRQPKNLFDSQQKERRQRLDKIHEGLERNKLYRAGDYDVNDPEYLRALNCVLNMKGRKIYAGVLVDEMQIAYATAHNLIAALAENYVLSAREGDGGRTVIWEE